ncbi:MAG: carboxy terminal-processing peptidase [Crocinitomicaceae bacterium]|nr:carboxy terminal-processing peptidase [Crocinitomicaceae bacterium]
MRLKKRYAFYFVAISFILFAFTKPGPTDEVPRREAILMELVLSSLQQVHYQQILIDDDLSIKVYDSYVDRVDNGKRFFLKSDVEGFNKYRLLLDDHAKSKNFEFFNLLTETFDKRVKQTGVFYDEILTEPFDFEKDESIETDADKIDYAKNDSELKSRWKKLLKYRVLMEIDTKLARQEKALEDSDTSVTIEPFEDLEINARAKVRKDFDRWFVNLGHEDREDKFAVYINTFANVIEPHTSYFPPLDKENFDIRMSGKLEGIGAQLLPKDGYIKITRIVPGSASWKQGELKVNDLIMKVGQGSEEPIDIVDMDMDDVLPMIRGKKGTEVRLTVKKEGGEIVTISIVRDVVILEESYAKSALIKDAEDKERVGIIDLRSFYADFNDRDGRRSSVDMRKEVQKLVADKVDGIIIDLRYNGGGSLYDAVEIAGLFIKTGPVVQVASRRGAPTALEDKNPMIAYDGPLVILVNSFSASASEILAAALQDYGRAVIIGTAPSTFGKGTVQRFYGLDDRVPESLSNLGEMGSVKITTQKFFRINGGSTQLKGVVPDIILPGVYSYISSGEKDEDFAMPWTEIEPSDYKESFVKKMNSIKKKSALRVESSEILAMIDERAKWIKEQREDSKMSLNLTKYREQQAMYREKSEEYNALVVENERLQIDLVSADVEALKSDTIRAASMETWHKSLKKDPYIMEAVEVLGDW